VLQLVEVNVGVRVVHQRVEVFHGAPHGHFPLVELQKLLFFLHYEVVRLVAVVEPVKLPHRVPFRGFVVAVGVFGLGRLFRFGVAAQYVLLPLIKATQGCNFFRLETLVRFHKLRVGRWQST
jgi:hypothetical protein